MNNEEHTHMIIGMSICGIFGFAIVLGILLLLSFIPGFSQLTIIGLVCVIVCCIIKKIRNEAKTITKE